ncbi:MAG: sulfotransferase [Symploca sp. SIO1C4]|uniref:Sulfotransferase n=1 Tax=Symploca sp. SIO1C4 TaxID=2607765 RepID=A0A6B3NDN6_9CYAN|nr:sulfotransferase [Symploca sp. SIO1C4]
MTADISLASQPIFLIGAERSGTTVLRLMLDHHPKITFEGELLQYVFDRMPIGDGWSQLDQFYDQFEEWLNLNRISSFTIDRRLSYPELVKTFLYQSCASKGKPIIGVTFHRNFDRLLRIWSDARFIHLIRDGRDVAYSCVGMGWAGNVWSGVERWIETEKLWTELRDLLSVEQRIEITYETLISEPSKTLTCLCNFIGVPYEPAMLSYPQTTTYNLPDPNLMGKWRHKLSDYEIQLVESKIGNMLVERGYKLSGLPPVSINSAIENRLRLQDWWARLGFRIQRNGLTLFLLDYLTRYLGLKQWQRSVKQKLYAIKQVHCK